MKQPIRQFFSKETYLPEPVTPENYPELSESFYANLNPNKTAMRMAHFAMAQLYKPGISYEPGAAKIVHDNFVHNRPMIIAANHDLFEDQYVIGSAMYSQPTLRPFVGSTVILAKAPYFATPTGRIRNDKLSALPVFRPQDLLAYVLETKEQMTKQQIFGLDDDQKARFAEKYESDLSMYATKAAKGMLRMTASQLERGNNMFVFPEGTRNKDRKTWRRMQKLEGGIGTIACSAVRKGIDATVVPIMVAYTGTSARAGSHVHVSRPIEPGTKKDDFMQRLESAMQHGLTSAYEALDK